MDCLRNGYFAFDIVWMRRAGNLFFTTWSDYLIT